MSLSTWLRDYLYFPLGGSRGSSLLTSRNLMITLVISGLWHGAAWHFVAFGAMHGVALVIYVLWSQHLGDRITIPTALGNLLTMVWWVLSLAYFRASDFVTGTAIVQAAFGAAGGTQLLGDRLVWVALLLAGIHWLTYRRLLTRWWKALPAWYFAPSYGAAWALAFSLAHFEATPFIYFQF